MENGTEMLMSKIFCEPVLAFMSSKSKIATPVVSLPVPAVVGTYTYTGTQMYIKMVGLWLMLVNTERQKGIK